MNAAGPRRLVSSPHQVYNFAFYCAPLPNCVLPRGECTIPADAQMKAERATVKTKKNAQHSLGALQIFSIGFGLFGMFFGAGNLIIPALLGSQSGQKMPFALTGFVITSVLLPLSAVIAVALSGHGLVDLASRVSHHFGMIYAVLIYLAIGPIYALPRTGAVSYELSIQTVMPDAAWWVAPLFLTVFFLVAFIVCYDETRLMDYLGKFLIPVMAILIAVLCIAGIAVLPTISHTTAPQYASSALAQGLLQGYSTMDALAALVFTMIVVQAIRFKTDNSTSSTWKASILAGSISALAMGLFYVGLTVLGSRVPGEFTNGAQVLAIASDMVFGKAGHVFFAATVILACVTTAMGLFGACGAFFHSVFPKVSYHRWLVIILILSILMSCMGLTGILAIVIPITQFLYPVAIALIVITLLDVAAPGHLRFTYRIAVSVAGILGLVDAIDGGIALAVGPDGQGFSIYGCLPDSLTHFLLADIGMAWVIPTVVAIIIGLAFDWRSGQLTKPREHTA